MNTKFRERRKFVKLASGLLVTPFASLAGAKAHAADDKPPLRILTIIDSYGVPTSTRSEVWVNSTTGDYALTGDELGTILEPFKAYKDNMLIVSGINLDSSIDTGDGNIHENMNTHCLSGSKKLAETKIGSTAKTLHASLDVHIGEYMNDEYGLASARAYSHLFFTNSPNRSLGTFCHDNTGAQVRSLAGPKSIAESIFTNGADINSLAFENDKQQGVFDLVQERINALRGQLDNANTATVMDAYFSSVDDLAAQLQLSSANVCEIPGDIDTYPTTARAASTELGTSLIFDNINQAFACDLSSSITYGIGGEKVNSMGHSFLYDAEEHNDTSLQTMLGNSMHTMSHRKTDVAYKAQEVIRTYQSGLTADLLDKMSVTPDVDGSSVLDNTVIFVTSVMGSNIHSRYNYPYLLIAGKNTNLKGGYHYDCDGSTNNDLLTTIAQGMGLPDDSFGGHNANGVYLDSLNNGPITKMLVS